MGRDAEIATVYDNPIAAVNKKRPPFVDDSNGKNDIYDNPNDTSPTENNNLLSEYHVKIMFLRHCLEHPSL